MAATTGEYHIEIDWTRVAKKKLHFDVRGGLAVDVQGISVLIVSIDEKGGTCYEEAIKGKRG